MIKICRQCLNELRGMRGIDQCMAGWGKSAAAFRVLLLVSESHSAFQEARLGDLSVYKPGRRYHGLLVYRAFRLLWAAGRSRPLCASLALPLHSSGGHQRKTGGALWLCWRLLLWMHCRAMLPRIYVHCSGAKGRL